MSGLSQTEINHLEKFLLYQEKIKIQREQGIESIPADVFERNRLDLWLSTHLWFWKSSWVDDGKGGKK